MRRRYLLRHERIAPRSSYSYRQMKTRFLDLNPNIIDKTNGTQY